MNLRELKISYLEDIFLNFAGFSLSFTNYHIEVN